MLWLLPTAHTGVLESMLIHDFLHSVTAKTKRLQHWNIGTPCLLQEAALTCKGIRDILHIWLILEPNMKEHGLGMQIPWWTDPTQALNNFV